MKLAYFIHSLYGAGTTIQADLICRHLTDAGHDVTLVVGSRTGVNSVRFETAPYPIVSFAQGQVSKPKLIYKLAQYLRQNPDAIFLSGAKKVNMKAILARRLARHKAPFILTLTNNILQQNSQTGQGKQASAKKHYRQYSRADKIIVLSRAMEAEMLDAGLPPEKLFFCPPPIDIKSIKTRSAAGVAHKWLGRPKSEREVPVVLSAGRWDVQKNFPLLIRAFAKARQERPMHLIIMGSGDNRELGHYRTLAEGLGVANQIDFTGFVPNPYAYMAKADLFALSSDWEGFGLVLAEALVCGAPVVSTDCPHGPAEILDGCQNTRLTPTGDVDGFATGLLKLIDAKSPASDQVMSRYDIEAIGRKYEELLAGFD